MNRHRHQPIGIPSGHIPQEEAAQQGSVEGEGRARREEEEEGTWDSLREDIRTVQEEGAGDEKEACLVINVSLPINEL